MIQRKDFILRLVDQFGEFLRRVFETKKDDKHAAGLLVESAIQQITTLNMHLFDMLDFESVVRMAERHKRLTAHECAIVARLLIERAELHEEKSAPKAKEFWLLAEKRYLNPHTDVAELLEFLRAYFNSSQGSG